MIDTIPNAQRYRTGVDDAGATTSAVRGPMGRRPNSTGDAQNESRRGGRHAHGKSCGNGRPGRWRFAGNRSAANMEPPGSLLPVVVLMLLTGPALAAAPAGQTAAATAPAEQFVYQQEPFDQITLNAANDSAVLKVQPLSLPGHRLPKKRSGKLRIRLVDRPEKLYELDWKDVAEVKFFPQLVLEEAERLVKAGRYDMAFHPYALLLESYPETPGLEASVDNYLFQNAAASYRVKHYDGALQLLIELHQRNPQFKGLQKTLTRVADRKITTDVANNRFAVARSVLDLVARTFPGTTFPFATKWKQEFIRRATILAEQSRRQVDQKKYDDALRACRQALVIWPSLQAARELERRIYREFPHAVVGVMLPVAAQRTERLDDWASWRTARLVDRHLIELNGYGAKGARYACPFGKLQQDASGMTLTIALRPALRFPAVRRAWTGYDLSQRLLAMAAPGSGPLRALWNDLLGTLVVQDVFQLRIGLTRQYIRPAALLRIRPRASATSARQPSDAGTGPYVLAAKKGNTARFVLASGTLATTPPVLQQITERTFTKAPAARRALNNSEIDALDRVAPWAVAGLRTAPQITVGSYQLPTIHMLIPNPNKPLPATATLRRALCYGINRQTILRDIILNGHAEPGFVVLSGPFPVGLSVDDPIGAAADRSIAPYPYEPRLALILATVAGRDIAVPHGPVSTVARNATPGQRSADGKKPDGDKKDATTKESHPLPPLVLAYRNEPVARIACEAIQAHLKIVGIRIVLKAITDDEASNPLAHADLLYAELAMWEPVVDALRLFGDGGLTGSSSPYMRLALEQLARARHWQEAREQLHAVHRIVHEENTVIPLWQTYNHFAYRKALRGVAKNPVTLYQGVRHWTISAPE